MTNENAIARVRVQSSKYTYEGNVHVTVKAGGYRSRVSDILDENSQFLALTDVTAREAGAGATATSTHYDVILLRKGDIMFVEPLS